MTKVITYGTYDLLHYGHIRLLERAKALGDYLIVGVTSDDYDKTRGKINNQQSLMERIAAVKATGLADEIIVEEYEGQKIDDIRRLGVDIFTVGSDWKGYFDYLSEYCKVVYLDRTEGVSSSEIRAEKRKLRIGLVGDEEIRILNKYIDEFGCVNGVEITGVFSEGGIVDDCLKEKISYFPEKYEELLSKCDAIYIISHPQKHYAQIKAALSAGKHVLVESPVALNKAECEELFDLAEKEQVVLMDAIKTAYSTAYNRLLLIVKSGKIGKVVSVDATCTSIRDVDVNDAGYRNVWNSICAWGPTAFLPVFQILGCNYKKADIASLFLDRENKYDSFTKVDFLYDNAVASVKVARGVKSEGELIVSGTKGYIYVPAPWWKTDYFETRYENPSDNRRFFYQLDGEGIRYMLVSFIKSIQNQRAGSEVSREISATISQIMQDFYNSKTDEIRR